MINIWVLFDFLPQNFEVAIFRVNVVSSYTLPQHAIDLILVQLCTINQGFQIFAAHFLTQTGNTIEPNLDLHKSQKVKLD